MTPLLRGQRRQCGGVRLRTQSDSLYCSGEKVQPMPPEGPCWEFISHSQVIDRINDNDNDNVLKLPQTY
eukprot:COSAG02_NODE_397_length_23124_cov_439.255635_6_plen_69_part_00